VKTKRVEMGRYQTYNGTIVKLPAAEARSCGISREQGKPERIGVKLDSSDDGLPIPDSNIIEPNEISWQCLPVIGAQVRISATFSGYVVRSPYG
jgi:hypothetical protein